jgi:hypothetical protein
MDFLGQLYKGEYWFSRFLLQRSLAFIYLLSFVNTLNQFPALCGKNGLLPIGLYLERVSSKGHPAFSSGDTLISYLELWRGSESYFPL